MDDKYRDHGKRIEWVANYRPATGTVQRTLQGSSGQPVYEVHQDGAPEDATFRVAAQDVRWLGEHRPALWDDLYFGPRYRYGLTHGPSAPGAVPLGRIIHADRHDGRFAFGTIAYPWPLTEYEIEGYELTPCGEREGQRYDHGVYVLWGGRLAVMLADYGADLVLVEVGGRPRWLPVGQLTERPEGDDA